jgi:hypothetical protein
MRRLFALAVVVLHVLLVALLMSGVRLRVDPDQEGRVFVSLWFPVVERMLPEALPESSPSTPAPRSTTPGSAVRVVEESAAETTPVETAAISTPTPLPAVDWSRQGTLAAQRAAAKAAQGEQKTFSPSPVTIPEPCKPKKSSMAWNGQEDRKVVWAGPLPVFKVGKRCIVTIGFFACNLNEIPEANSHLLDDMRKPDRATSSVPDPNICD